MKTFLFATVLAITWSASANAQTETKEFKLSDISRIEVNNSGGEINILVSDSDKVKVTAHKDKFDDNCQMVIEQKRRTLVVELKKKSMFKSSCSVDFTIAAPRSVDLDLDSGRGDVTVKGTSGDLKFMLGSGSVNVDAEVKELDGKTGSGDISIKGLTAGGNLKTGSGDLKLIYSVAPKSGELDIITGSGDAEIILPKSAKIRTKYRAGFGDLINEVGDTVDSKFKINMKAGSGDLHIKH